MELEAKFDTFIHACWVDEDDQGTVICMEESVKITYAHQMIGWWDGMRVIARICVQVRDNNVLKIFYGT
jgi:hypothetical protein